MFVEPIVYWIGETRIRHHNNMGLYEYLHDTDQRAFQVDMIEAEAKGLADGELLTSFNAKLCYSSLAPGKNENLTGVRDISGNLQGVIDQGHGSVWEHAMLNFVIHNCSRVFEVELVRHRVGTAFSIQSGRYFRGTSFDVVGDPIVKPVESRLDQFFDETNDFYQDLVNRLGLNGRAGIKKALAATDVFDDDQGRAIDDVDQNVKVEHYITNELDYDPDRLSRDDKKKITSALRRMLPEGKAKEIGFSCNLRTLRFLVQLRTSRHAEREIRNIFGQIYRLVKPEYPTVFSGAVETVVDGLVEVSGMKIQPWEPAAPWEPKKASGVA